MKKVAFTSLLIIFTLVAASNAQAQINKGNIIVGGDIANFNLGFGDGGITSITLNPKVGWFIQDGLALGAQLSFGAAHTKNVVGTTITYGIGAFGRYYISDRSVEVVKHSKFFFEANAGISGENVTDGGASTNGLGLGFGPGWTYFITPNIGLEALLKYNGIVGFGSEAYKNHLSLNVGFQIYLSSKKVKSMVK